MSFLPINVGSGHGVTVHELVTAFQGVPPTPLQVGEAPRCPGDSAGAYAETSRARVYLGWATRLGVTQAIQDAFT